MAETFQSELRDIINRYSMENGSDTPDYLLAAYLGRCLDNWNETVTERERWYGRGPKFAPADIAEKLGTPAPEHMDPATEADMIDTYGTHLGKP